MILKNNFLTVRINPIGAELQSILTIDGKQILWQAHPEYWAKTSPVLFPIVGGLKSGYYIYNKKKYYLNRHGFGRECIFEEQKITDKKGVFSLKSTKKTQEMYPFDFILKICYTLKESKLTCTYEIENTGNEPMYFSIGAHPAFSLGTSKEDFENYELFFPDDEQLICSKLHDGLLSEETQTLPLNKRILHLKYSLFYDDALILKSLKSKEIILRNKNKATSISFQFDHFPYFGIWSAKNANFICLEPWCGIADNLNHNHELTHKEGIVTLDSNEKHLKSWSVTISQ